MHRPYCAVTLNEFVMYIRFSRQKEQEIIFMVTLMQISAVYKYVCVLLLF